MFHRDSIKAGGSAMVVDDSPTQRDHAVRLCREIGIGTVYEASNGVEAIALLGMLALPPTYLVVDLEMPGMDGVELLQELARLEVDAAIVVVSSREVALIESVQAMGNGLGLHVLAALSKPLSARSLQRALSAQTEPCPAPDAAHERLTGPTPTVAELAQAIQEDAIHVQYQPKVDVRTGLVRGVEVLARWRHPQLGPICPAHFVALAEQHDLIWPLTCGVFRQALRQASQWNSVGLRLPMSINLSPHVLRRPGVVDHIAGVAEQQGIAAGQVVLELTESAVVSQADASLGVLTRLRLKGFGLSIDDYGTGYSSMQQLARVPFTELKIDRSFVHGACQRRSLQIILQSALSMADQLGLVTVAEGVETMEDWRLIQTLGCKVAQGWLIGRAMDAGGFKAWLNAHSLRVADLRMQTGPRHPQLQDA